MRIFPMPFLMQEFNITDASGAYVKPTIALDPSGGIKDVTYGEKETEYVHKSSGKTITKEQYNNKQWSHQTSSQYNVNLPSGDAYYHYEPKVKYKKATWDGSQWVDTGTYAYEGEGLVHHDAPSLNSIPRATPDTQSIGSRDDYGAETLTATEAMAMTPRQMAERIFKTKYGERVPSGGGDDYAEGDKESFLQFLEREYAQRGPTLSEVPKQEIAHARSKTKRDVYGLQDPAAEISSAMGNIYDTGSGVGMRAGIAGQDKVKEKFGDIYASLDETVYGLEKEQEAKWETSFMDYYGSLPKIG